MKTLQRSWLFLQAYLCLLKIHRTLEREGFDGARRRFLRDWKTHRVLDAKAHQAKTRDIEWAVEQACAWQWKRSVCLHRALATYALLRAAGAKPHFVMAVTNRPFASHAWTELDAQPIADAAMQESRYLYKQVLRIPQPTK